jgi:hypothetical protein
MNQNGDDVLYKMGWNIGESMMLCVMGAAFYL